MLRAGVNCWHASRGFHSRWLQLNSSYDFQVCKVSDTLNLSTPAPMNGKLVTQSRVPRLEIGGLCSFFVFHLSARCLTVATDVINIDSPTAPRMSRLTVTMMSSPVSPFPLRCCHYIFSSSQVYRIKRH